MIHQFLLVFAAVIFAESLLGLVHRIVYKSHNLHEEILKGFERDIQRAALE